MTTTFEKYQGTQRGNYCTLPTIDVEIIEPPGYCRNCSGVMVYDPKARLFGAWVHETEPEPGTCRYASVASRCGYCGTNEKGVVVFHQRAYSDETECSRCGGVSGYGIGD